MKPVCTFNNKNFLWLIALIFLLPSLLYFQVLRHNFVNFDDDGYVYNNQFVRSGISVSGIIYAFTTIDKGNWIPLTWLSHMLDVQFYGLNPWGHHLTNLLFHILNAFLLFLFLKISTQRLCSSFIVAILFAIHPLHVESVAWISERKDVISTFFGLLALIIYVHYSSRKDFKKYLAVFFLFLCSLMSKPMLVTMPLLFLLIDHWPLQRLPNVFVSQNSHNLWIFVIEKIPFLILSLIFCIIAIWGQKSVGALGVASKYPLSVRLMNAMISYVEYIYKTICPTNLSVIYPYPSNISLVSLMISVMILTLITCFVFFLRDQIPALLVGWLWFLITLIPVIGLLQVGTQAMADRYTYVPLIGLFISGVWGIQVLIVRFRIRSWVVVLATASVIFTFSMMTINQASVWKDSQALFSHALSVTQNNWAAHLNYGEALMEKGQADASIKQYQQAIKINPGVEMAYLNLGVAFSKKGETDMAINYYNKAIEINKNLPAAWLNLGNAYLRKGMFNKALSYYETALSLQADFAEAYYGIGAVMAGRGDLQKAKKAFQQALVFDPGLTSAKTSIMRIEQKINDNSH